MQRGVFVLECGHCFGLSGLIALIIVAGKTGWLMDLTGAVAPFKKFSHFKSCGLLNRKSLLCGFRFGEMVKGCLRFSLGFILNLLTQTCKIAFMVCPIPLLQTDKFELFKGS